MYILNLKQIIETKLSLDYSNPNSSQINKVLEDEIYSLLNKSVLAGEYYLLDFETTLTSTAASFDKIAKDLPTKIDYLKSRLSISEQKRNVGSSPTEEDREKEKENLQKLTDINLIFKRFEKYFKIYKRFSGTISKNFQNISEGKLIDDVTKSAYYYFKLKDEILDILEEKPDSKKLFDFLFQINISLAYIDEYLECNDISRNKLRDINEYLEIKKDSGNIILTPLLKILSSKSKFLEIKILTRLSKKDSNFDNTLPFSTFYSTLCSHYHLYSEKDLISEDEIIQNISNNKVSITQIHRFNKLCRLNTKLSEDEKLEKLIAIENALIKKGNENTLLKFDHFSLNSAIGLLTNARIQLKLTKEKASDFSKTINEFKDYILGLRKEVKISVFDNCKTNLNEVARKYKMHDYYGYSKLLDFLEHLIESLRNDTNTIISRELSGITEANTKEYKEKINQIVNKITLEYKYCLSKYKENLEISESIEQKPVYLTFSECTEEYIWDKEEKINLFLDSAYILPNNYYKEKINLQSKEAILASNFRPLRNRVDIDLNLQLTKAKNLEFEKKVKENEFKVVQITAMFVSIATFVLINVKIFEAKRPIESIGIMLGLASCFLLFNGFFKWIITGQIYGNERNKNIFRDTFFRLTLFLIILSIALLFFSYSYYEV